MNYTAVVETFGAAIDIAGVVLIILGLLIATGRYLSSFRSIPDSYTRYRQDIGRAILLGLEVLVAADIIRTVAVTPTLISVTAKATKWRGQPPPAYNVRILGLSKSMSLPEFVSTGEAELWASS